MPYIPPSVVQEVKRMDLLTYLKNYEPYELVHFSGNTYTTRTHDSLKISNGKWMWWSQRTGGRSALDYLIKVRGYSFLEAVELLAERANIQPPLSVSENVPIEYLDTLLERVAKICPSARNKGREILSIAMKDAVRDKFINYNPMPETKPYPRPKPKVRVLSKEKLKVLLEAASKNPWYLEILLGLFCGLRKGEILGLKFQDFDFEKQTVRISRQIVGNLKVKEQEFTITEYAVIERNPKTENSYRILRVPKVVMREVKRRQQLIDKRKADMGAAYKDYDYVSCQENGEPRSLTAMNQALTKICKRNGLPNITVHGLRHMFATILIELGVPLFKISGLLGHSSVHTTYEYYCEIMDEQDKIIAFVNNTFVPERTGTEGELCIRPLILKDM